MKRFTVIGVLFLLLVMVPTVVDSIRSRSFVARVHTIKVGDSRNQVIAVLGRATQVLTPPPKIPRGLYLGVRVGTWAYGSRFDWRHCFYSKFPYFWPLKFRLFGPDVEDVEVAYDSAGKVSGVWTPTK